MENNTFNDKLMSDQIDQLATALAKAQAEFSIAGLNQKNPFFKSNYADYQAVVNATRPALSKYGLSVSHPPCVSDDGQSYLVTLLMHSSGQWIKSKARHNPQKSDVQALASYNTYLRRMCYSSIVGAVTGEIDDDGESSMVRNQIPDSHYKSFVVTLPTERQAKICSHYNVNSINELSINQCKEIYATLNNK